MDPRQPTGTDVPHRDAAPATALPQIGKPQLLRPWRLFVRLLVTLVLCLVRAMGLCSCTMQ